MTTCEIAFDITARVIPYKCCRVCVHILQSELDPSLVKSTQDIHSYQEHCPWTHMTLNGSLIFQGEIARYCVLFVCVRQLFVCFTVKTCSALSISCDKREKRNINTDLSMITLSVTKLQRPRFVLCGLLHPSISSFRAIFVLKHLPSQQFRFID